MLYGIKYSYSVQIIFKEIYLTLTGTITLGQSGHGSNGNEGVVHTTHIFRSGTSPSGVG